MQAHSASDIFGLDLSHYETVNDWNSVKAAGVKFIYCKATQGTTFNDPKFADFVNGAHSVSIPVGAYHFAGLNDPVAEAQHFKQVIDQYQLELIPVLDLEQSASGVDLVQWVRKFVDALGGIKIILYTGNWFIEANTDLNALGDIPLWTSYYRTTPPPDEPGWKVWTMWQYSDKGSVPGVEGLVDVDYGVDLNNILKVIPAPPQPTIQDYVRGAINSLTKKGYINSPQTWLEKLDKGEELSDLAILLLDKVAK